MSVSADPYSTFVSHVSARFAAIVTAGAAGRPPRNRDPYTTSVSPRENRRDQSGQLRGIELEVRVLNRDDRSRRLREAAPHGVALPAIHVQMHDREVRAASRPSRRAPRACRRAIRR